MGELLTLVLFAGLAAGITLGAFHWFATEPVIDAAIALEAAHQTDSTEPVVSREVQRVGLLFGSAIYGLIFAAFFAIAYAVLHGSGLIRPGWWSVAGLGLAAYWALALFPTLKYPANPPGVGDPETIGFRQAAFVLCWVLSVSGVAIAVFVSSRLMRPGSPRVVALLVSLAAWFLLLYWLLPANPDPVSIDLDLVNAFRFRSLVGLGVFWSVLAAVFGAIVSRPSRVRPNRSLAAA